ncbi:MAG: hypothetical protein RL030_1765 [Pseudomonadota bacterium]|jgi:hypothetical protein
MTTASLPFRVCLYLGINPLSALTLAEIEERFGADPGAAWQSLEPSCRNGMLVKTMVRGGQGQAVASYSAGPALLACRTDAAGEAARLAD